MTISLNFLIGAVVALLISGAIGYGSYQRYESASSIAQPTSTPVSTIIQEEQLVEPSIAPVASLAPNVVATPRATLKATPTPTPVPTPTPKPLHDYYLKSQNQYVAY